MLIALLVLAAMSLIALALYAWDKRQARRAGSRVRESTLLWVAALGGAAGALLAMRWRRHKTQHLRFRILVPLFLVLHLAGLAWLGTRGP